MSFALTHLAGFGARRASFVDATGSFVTSAVSTSGLTTYTFSSQSLGAAAAGRRIVVCCGGWPTGGPRTVDAVTVAGVSATKIGDAGGTSSGSVIAGMYIAQVDSGTTGDVVVTYSGAMHRTGIGIFRIVDLQSSTPTNTQEAEGTGNPLSVSMSCSAGGVIVGASAMVNGSALGTYTWAGIDESYDQAISGVISQSGGFKNFAAAQSGLAVSTTYSQTPNWVGGLVVAAFR